MSWKNLPLPVQSLIFGAAVAFLAWLLSPYLPRSRHIAVPCDAVGAQTGACNHSGDEPYDMFAPRPRSRSIYDAGLGLRGKGRRP
jgi:hypothetical protein